MAAIIKQKSRTWKWRKASRKQNWALSEKEAWIAREIIKDAGNKEKKQTQKNRGMPMTTIKSKRLEVNKSAGKTR